MSLSETNQEQQIAELMLKYEFAKDMLETQIHTLIREFEFKNYYNPVEHIKSRLKTKESIANKLCQKGFSFTPQNIIAQIHDVVGIRIVCSFLSDVYEIVNIIHNSSQFKIKKEKDYIQSPKETGYISYHLIVQVPIYLNSKVEFVEAEIQIRTIAMDFWASLDHKIQYKLPKEIPSNIQEELYQCSLVMKTLDQRMNQINDFIHNHEKASNS